jgi:hypothetical protein
MPPSPNPRAAKLAGTLYLLTMATAIFSEFYVRGSSIVLGNATDSVTKIAASPALFRLGIASDLIFCLADVALVAALYVILKPVHRTLALQATFWWLIECAILAAVSLNDFAALELLSGADSLRSLTPDQLQALARFFFSLERTGYRIGMLFFGLGSIIFCYLWFKSRYIPRALAVWGILASLVPLVVSFALLVVPALDATYGPFRRGRSGGPILLFEGVIGVWLLAKGILPL